MKRKKHPYKIDMKNDDGFLLIIKAACALGDGRERHIRTYKRLIGIIEEQKQKIALLQQKGGE